MPLAYCLCSLELGIPVLLFFCVVVVVVVFFWGGGCKKFDMALFHHSTGRGHLVGLNFFFFLILMCGVCFMIDACVLVTLNRIVQSSGHQGRTINLPDVWPSSWRAGPLPLSESSVG